MGGLVWAANVDDDDVDDYDDDDDDFDDDDDVDDDDLLRPIISPPLKDSAASHMGSWDTVIWWDKVTRWDSHLVGHSH